MFIFTKSAEKALYKINSLQRDNILSKLKSIKEQKLSWDFSSLRNFWIATHRLRVGDYRLILQKTDDCYIVLDVWHRREIYK